MRLAFVGLGAMGGPMARQIARDPSMELTLFDIDAPTLAAASELGQPVDSVERAARDADVLISVLPADRHVRDVAAAVRAAGRPGLVYADFSTIAPDTIVEVAKDLADAGIRTVSATCMRSVAAAEKGELSLFVGGEDGAISKLMPALECVSSEWRDVGSLAGAKALKLSNNLIVADLDVMLCEALLVAARHGCAPYDIVDAFAQQGAESWALRNHVAKHALTDDVGPGRFSTRYMSKDLELAAKFARARGRPAFFTALTLACYRGVIAHGHADSYHPVVLRWLERGACMDLIASQSRGRAAPSPALVAAVGTLQALITLEGVAIGTSIGLPAEKVIAHLASGSAENDCLRDLLHGGGIAERPVGQLLDDLEVACTEVRTAEVSAFTFEIGSDVVASLLGRCGADTTLADAAGFTPAARAAFR